MARKTRKTKHNLLLQTFWTGKPLSRMERAALQSYVNVGHTIHIYTYNPIHEFIQRVPQSRHIKVHDAREILPEDQLFQYAGRAEVGKRNDAYSYLPFSDLFRFTMLHKKGGAWIDLDIFLVRPIPLFAKPYVFSSERTIQKGAYRKVEPEIVDMGFIKVPGPASPLTTWILEHIPKGLLTLKSPFDYMNLYRKAITALALESYVLPADAFLPLNWWDVKEAFANDAGLDGTCYRGKYGTPPFCVDILKSPKVYGVHWFRAILRKKGLPYEDAKDRETEHNLYDRMIQTIEADGGLALDEL